MIVEYTVAGAEVPAISGRSQFGSTGNGIEQASIHEPAVGNASAVEFLDQRNAEHGGEAHGHGSHGATVVAAAVGDDGQFIGGASRQAADCIGVEVLHLLGGIGGGGHVGGNGLVVYHDGVGHALGMVLIMPDDKGTGGGDILGVDLVHGEARSLGGEGRHVGHSRLIAVGHDGESTGGVGRVGNQTGESVALDSGGRQDGLTLHHSVGGVVTVVVGPADLCGTCSDSSHIGSSSSLAGRSLAGSVEYSNLREEGCPVYSGAPHMAVISIVVGSGIGAAGLVHTVPVYARALRRILYLIETNHQVAALVGVGLMIIWLSLTAIVPL